jgi:lipoprotein-anchoring transpeptidase ErfK/SrfK
VERQDVVVVVLSEGAQRPLQRERPTPERRPVGGWGRTALRGAVGAIGAAATLLLGVLTAVAVSPSLVGKDDRRPSSVAPPAFGGADAGRAEGATGTRFDAYAARVRGREVAVYDRPSDDATLLRFFPGVGDYDARQTFLVEREQRQPDGVWYQVLLPVRPNGTTGWVKGREVELTGLPYRIEVRLGSLQLLLFRDGRLERTFPIGIGTVHTPTPPGRYSIKYLMRPDDQNTLYGHYVYGLSGFSDAVRDTPGGGELGIHGTNDPDGSIGRRVSQGCIRLRNDDIGSLVPLLPLGTPVDVVDDGAPK